jgi:hypothetical protein
MSPAAIEKVLDKISKLADSSVVPVPVAAKHDNVSERTIWRNYPITRLSPGRSGVRVGYLRNRKKYVA